MPGPTASISAVPTFARTELSNGTRLLTASLPHAQSVSCFVMLAAGSRYERREESGIAHFAEHMFFKGTERRPTARDIATEIDSIGGEFNAFTGKELTGYYVKCAAETRDVALDVLVDMLRSSRFDADEIEREKGVIVEEMNMYADTPRSYVGNVWEQHVYGDQPLGWDIIGTEETIRAANRDTFLGYLERWYKPERMVVGLGGNVRRFAKGHEPGHGVRVRLSARVQELAGEGPPVRGVRRFVVRLEEFPEFPLDLLDRGVVGKGGLRHRVGSVLAGQQQNPQADQVTHLIAPRPYRESIRGRVLR